MILRGPGSKFRLVDRHEFTRTNDRLTRGRRLDDLIGGRVAQKRLQRVRIDLVTAAIGAVAADELCAGERQIATASSVL